MLTRKQQELLLYINDRLAGDGISPSFEEMKNAVGLKSKSGIHRLIVALEERGFIRRLPYRARALEVLKLPAGLEAAAPVAAFVPRPQQRRARPAGGRMRRLSGRATALALHGRIAAGTPIEALSDPGQSIDVPATMVGSRDCFALEIEGDSMAEAGIFEGDVVIVERSESAENGTVVVALIDEREVTLKRLRRRGHSIALEPANAAYETRIFGPGRVRIQGRLIGLLRRY